MAIGQEGDLAVAELEQVLADLASRHQARHGEDAEGPARQIGLMVQGVGDAHIPGGVDHGHGFVQAAGLGLRALDLAQGLQGLVQLALRQHGGPQDVPQHGMLFLQGRQLVAEHGLAALGIEGITMTLIMLLPPSRRRVERNSVTGYPPQMILEAASGALMKTRVPWARRRCGTR